MKIRTLIVDDESLARDRLRQLLRDEPEIEVVGESADGKKAVELIHQKLPDLIFLDVQMPEMDGFRVLEAIRIVPAPVIVFVTAYDKFALRAFEVHAVDYLLKPFDRERFLASLRHAIEQVKKRESAALSQSLSTLIAELKSPSKAPEQLAVKTAGRVVFVRINDIDWIDSSQNYVELHVGEESHLMRQTIEAMEARLPTAKFARISRSTIVNTEKIRELQYLAQGGYRLILRNGTQLSLSRRYRDSLKQLVFD